VPALTFVLKLERKQERNGKTKTGAREEKKKERRTDKLSSGALRRIYLAQIIPERRQAYGERCGERRTLFNSSSSQKKALRGEPVRWVKLSQRLHAHSQSA
jgi:hypothetical protein